MGVVLEQRRQPVGSEELPRLRRDTTRGHGREP